MDKIQEVLERYLPAGTANIITDWIYDYRVHLHIKRNRRTKSGDYRPPSGEHPKHRISINHNLNPYAFLITMVHELAHRVVWEKYSGKASPHGNEWKNEFKKMMHGFLIAKVFPEELHLAVAIYMENPWASSSGDAELVRVLRKFDKNNSSDVLLEDLEEGRLFSIGDNRVFKKGKLQRKRFYCECISNHRIYLVNGIAQVLPIEPK